MQIIIRLIENLVSNSRIIPAIFIVIYVLFFYFVNLDNFFSISLLLLILYDFIYSNLISKIPSLSFLIFGIVFILFFQSFLIIIQPYLLFLFCVLLILFFIYDKFLKIFFFLLNFIAIFLFFYLLIVDRDIIFIILLISFLNDTSAFIFGRYFKGPLIIPSISPKKTWSGTSLSFMISATVLYLFEFNILFSILVSASFFIGDLFFSYFKRRNSLKDFSNLLYGHGGVLDRFDSIIFAIILTNILIIFGGIN